MFQPWVVFIVLVVAFTAKLAYAWGRNVLHYRRFAREHGCLPIRNANQLDPFLGLDHFFRLAKAASEKRYLEYWERNMFNKIGPTFSLNLMGQHLIFTNEPQNIQALLATKHADFDVGQRRRDNSADLLGIGIFNADGDAWAHARATLRPNLTRNQVADFQLFEKHFGVWMKAISANIDLVDLQEWAFRYTMDVGTDFLFDKSVGVLHAEASALGKKFAWAFKVGVDGISQRTRLGRLAPLYFNRDHKKACKVVHDFVDPLVETAVENAGQYQSQPGDKIEDHQRYTFLNALASEGMAPKKIRDQLINVLLAARDTSACLLGGIFFELARRKDVQQKLRAEVETQLQGRLPTYDDLKNMRYLNWVVKETLRLYPPVPLNIRVANKDTCLPLGGGTDGKAPIVIRQGQEVVYQIFSTHRRQDIWGKDADDFCPERWETLLPGFQYLPFNAGPRICLGQQFATLETSYVVARFLQEFSGLERPPSEFKPWTEHLTLTCCVAQGSWATLKRKDSA